MADKYLGEEKDSIKLMRQLAKMANIEWGGFVKMVLVLSIDDMPRLFTEGYLSPVGDEQLSHVDLKAERVQGIVVDTNTMQNEVWRTKEPLPIVRNCKVKVTGGVTKEDIGREGEVLEILGDAARVFLSNGWNTWFRLKDLVRIA